VDILGANVLVVSLAESLTMWALPSSPDVAQIEDVKGYAERDPQECYISVSEAPASSSGTAQDLWPDDRRAGECPPGGTPVP
jgi:hypothetical protein